MNTIKTSAWLVWILASIFYAYQYILRVMPSIMLQDIMTQFDISAATFGQFSGVYYIGYSALHLPIGIMLDRFGPKKVMSSCILLTVLGMMPLIFAESFIYPVIGRFLIGIGSSAAILGLFKIIRITFSEKNFPRMLSISVMIGLIGAIYGGGPVSSMRDILGSEKVIQIFAIMGLILAALTYWIVPDGESSSEGTVFSDIKEVLSNKKVIWSCLFAGCMVGPLEGFADVWGATFLGQVYGFDKTMAASLPSMIFVGMCFGSPILSFIAEKTSYLGAIIGAGAAMAISFCFLLNGQLGSYGLTGSFILVGICSAYQILAIYKASTYVREGVAGLTTAMANMIIMMFGYAFHAVIGSVVDALGGAQTSEALLYGVGVIPAALCVGTAGFAALFFADRKSSPAVEAV